MSETFSCRLNLDRVHDVTRIDLIATDAERADIARRLGLVSLDRLAAHCVLDHLGRKTKAGVRIGGRRHTYLARCHGPTGPANLTTSPCLILRDRLGTLFTDAEFANFYPRRRQPAYAP